MLLSKPVWTQVARSPRRGFFTARDSRSHERHHITANVSPPQTITQCLDAAGFANATLRVNDMLMPKDTVMSVDRLEDLARGDVADIVRDEDVHTPHIHVRMADEDAQADMDVQTFAVRGEALSTVLRRVGVRDLEWNVSAGGRRLGSGAPDWGAAPHLLVLHDSHTPDRSAVRCSEGSVAIKRGRTFRAVFDPARNSMEWVVVR